VKREWFSVLAKEVLNPAYGLFQVTDSNVHHPSAMSNVHPDHLSYFHFIGMIIGLSIYHEQVCGVS
jgi:hypothetical protein